MSPPSELAITWYNQSNSGFGNCFCLANEACSHEFVTQSKPSRGAACYTNACALGTHSCMCIVPGIASGTSHSARISKCMKQTSFCSTSNVCLGEYVRLFTLESPPCWEATLNQIIGLSSAQSCRSLSMFAGARDARRASKL